MELVPSGQMVRVEIWSRCPAIAVGPRVRLRAEHRLNRVYTVRYVKAVTEGGRSEMQEH